MRIPVGNVPQIWGQSLYILSGLLDNHLLLPGEIDPLGKRMVAEPKPDLSVQVVVVAEDESIKQRLYEYGLDVETFNEIYQVSGIRIFPAKVLNHLYKHLAFGLA
ncbi:unnamed protein product [Protopolystoma xenopodis]|uniref:Phosphorylase b kinase regulatory subunit n=1 Tax=Protopolystoma xenopodis TaxID=117903 RepID=A0A3S5A3D9_9PLAT|nr:unnamed protein product [Protopolystoma xenopodis]